QILFIGWLDDPTEQHLYRVVPGETQVTKLTTDAGWHDVSVNRSGSHFLDRFTALGNSGEIRLRGVDEGIIETTLHTDDVRAPDHPYARYLNCHRQPDLGRIKAAHGHDLFYRLTQPKAANGALVVYVYGGPGAQRVRNEWSPLLLQLFVSRGIGVLELDNRGSANRGRSFESALYRQLGEAEVQDQLLGVAMAADLDWVDCERIGVFGHSYGGFMALMCLARAPEIFKAAVAVAPVSDWALYDTHYTERYLGTPAANPEGYLQSSLFPYLKDLRGALLLMHGMADDNVLFTHTTRLMHALQRQQFPFELMTYPGSKHALQEPHVSIHRFNRILDFFNRELCTP
ncbi:MAG: alpha/beta fold hydrolase, partial [Proteobacteria bacterium]|nr:alpha/beta fold hydrolase [Pseudomonadota bacterium]